MPQSLVIMTHRDAVTDVTLTQALHGKGSTCCGNRDSSLHSVISRYGLESFVYINHILTKLCR